MAKRIFAGAILTFGVSVANADVYQNIYNSVDRTNLFKLLKDMTGVNSFPVGGKTLKISDRSLPASKAKFRQYFTAFFQSLGMQVSELPYPTQYHLETQGHNVEAV